MSNQATNANGTVTQTHARADFISSPSTTSYEIEVTSPHLPVCYCYYEPLYNLE